MRPIMTALVLLFVCTCSDDSSPAGKDGSLADLKAGAEAGADFAAGDGPRADIKSADLPPPTDLKPSEAGGCPSGYFVLKDMGPGKCLKLPAGVTLPVDSAAEADAIKAASGCSCKCAKWEQKAGKWRCYCCDKYPDCLVEIDAVTATTRCELYG